MFASTVTGTNSTINIFKTHFSSLECSPHSLMPHNLSESILMTLFLSFALSFSL